MKERRGRKKARRAASTEARRAGTGFWGGQRGSDRHPEPTRLKGAPLPALRRGLLFRPSVCGATSGDGVGGRLAARVGASHSYWKALSAETASLARGPKGLTLPHFPARALRSPLGARATGSRARAGGRLPAKRSDAAALGASTPCSFLRARVRRSPLRAGAPRSGPGLWCPRLRAPRGRLERRKGGEKRGARGAVSCYLGSWGAPLNVVSPVEPAPPRFAPRDGERQVA